MVGLKLWRKRQTEGSSLVCLSQGQKDEMLEAPYHFER